MTTSERLDRLEADATNAYDQGNFTAYDRILDAIATLEHEYGATLETQRDD